MNSKTADLLELKTGCLPIEFDGVDGLFVFVEPYSAKRLAIAGQKGVTILTREQVIALRDGITGIIETYLEEAN